MKILGYNINITREDYASLYEKKCKEAVALENCALRLKRESNEAHLAYNALQKSHADIAAQYQEAKDTIFVREEDIKELRSTLEDTKSANAELNERLEKEQSDNCELQNLYSGKCKECELLYAQIVTLSAELDNISQKSAMIEEKLKAYEQDGYVVVKEDHYNKLNTVYEKKQIENETRNANRRKNRAAKAAAKKVAHAKPE